MRTQSQPRNNFPQQKASPAIVEPLRIELPFLEDQFQEDPPENPPEVPMADNRTMAELLQAPTKDYEDAIVIPEIAANNFELKHGLINLVQNKQSFGHDKEDPHAHIRYFNKITSTMRVPNSKVRQSRAKAVVAKVSTSSSAPAVLSEVAELKDMVRALLLDKKNQSSSLAHSPTHAPVKAVEPNLLLVVVPTRTKIVPLQAEMFIETTSKRSGTLHSNTITNPNDDLKGITTRSGVAYQRPTIPTSSKVVKQGTEVTKDQVQTPSSQSTAPVQPLVIQSKTQTPVSEPVVAPVSVLMPNLKPSIPYPSRRDNGRRHDQANEQIEKFYAIFKDIRMDECLALADLGASINLMPLFVWEGLSLPKLTPNCITLELVDRLVSKPISIAKNVSVKTGRALIDVHKGKLTLRIRNEAITYNLDQTVIYSANDNQMIANKINVICEEYSQEVLGFSDVTASGNLTPHDDLIVSTTSPTLTLFGDSDFLLFEEADAFLAILNSEPLPPLPNHEQYLPSFKKKLKVCEAKTVKSSVDEPPEVELKDLPPHLEYAFLEGDNKQVEVSNRGLKRILERTIGENHASWSDKLDDALWAFRTSYKTPIGCTPYKLVYGKACHLPIKLEHKAYWALKQANFDLAVAGDHRKVQLNELNELRDHAYENSLIYNEKIKRIHDSKIKNCVFNVGDRVLLFNSKLKIFSGKLKTRWSGPFAITKVFPYGTAELSQANGPNFKVNGHRIKNYFGGDVLQLVVPDL
nr:reverse transcriptase domain-containing protein [Tanacetum cinerariifolium]